MASNSTLRFNDPSREFGIAGAGRVARSLGKLLNDRGQRVVAVASRKPSRARNAAAFIGSGVQALTYAELASKVESILIAVSDDSIADVATTLALDLRKGTVLHTSGIHGTDVLAPLTEQGNSGAGLHPLQTIATPEQGLEKLPGSTFTIAGSGRAAGWAAQIINLLEGEILSIDSDQKPTYHVAAVMASNYVVSLIDAAVQVMGAAGVEPEAARRALAPLIGASVENALGQPAEALTGPIRRGDLQTLELHLQGLASLPPSIDQLYRSLGMHTVQVALEQGLESADAGQVEHLLRKAETGGQNQ
ncbi:MAG: Rossmann-like and DUF2520 domain-containing protein [Acidobacteriota bacterium]|nr:Rossmann-like and DUF2520 domain-containing protein [Acidobacteriota bacterium]